MSKNNIQPTTYYPQLILASASIGRKHLLQKFGIPFEVMPSEIDEEKISDQDSYVRLANRARAKAEDVIKRLASRKNRSKHYTLNANYLILAADSEALLNGKTYGKSRDKSHTKQMVSELMDHTHEFLTATCIIHCQILPLYKGELEGVAGRDNSSSTSPNLSLQRRGTFGELNRWESITKTLVTMRKLTTQELDEYISRYDFTRFAAGYTLNETPWDLITKIEGSYTNIIGLPFEVVLPIFRNFGLT